MIIYVDIDDTICNGVIDNDYSTAVPIENAIDKINNFYNDGHTIIYWTARGTETGIDWTQVTELQFKKWGVKYHELKFGKPVFDVLIDDRAFNATKLQYLEIES